MNIEKQLSSAPSEEELKKQENDSESIPSEEEIQDKNNEQMDSSIENLKHNDIVEKIKAKKDMRLELLREQDKLVEKKEGNVLNDDGGDLDAIDKEMMEKAEQVKKIEKGEKWVELDNNFKEEYSPLREEELSLYEKRDSLEKTKSTNDNYDEEISAIKNKLSEIGSKIDNLISESNNDKKDVEEEDQSLEYLEKEREKSISDMREKLGYDENYQKDVDKKFDDDTIMMGEAHKVMVNKYLEIDLPVFSKDFNTEKRKDKNGEEVEKIIWDGSNSNENRENQRTLLQKQISFYKDYKDKMKQMLALPKEDRDKINQMPKEDALLFDALCNFNQADIPGINKPKVQDASIANSFNGYSLANKKRLNFGYGKVKLDDQKVEHHKFSEHMAANSSRMMKGLICFKLAQDKGLL